MAVPECPGAKGVKGAFLHARKAGKPVLLAKVLKPIPAAGQQLMGIALVAHVEDQLILGAIIHQMQGDGQLHHAKIGGQVSPVFAGDLQDARAKLAGQRRQLVEGQALEILRALDAIQNGHDPLYPLAYFLNRVKQRPTKKTISLDLRMAKPLPRALPPTVRAAMKPATTIPI